VFNAPWAFNSPLGFNAPPPSGPEPPEPVLYDGGSVLEALSAWWADQTDLRALVSDGLVWHAEAPETTAEPYATYLLAAETERDGRTTDGAILDSLVQISIHAETDAQAVAIRKAVRKAVLNARLSVDGEPVQHVLPGGQTTGLGEGLGLGGRDCWVATFDLEIAHSIDSDSE